MHEYIFRKVCSQSEKFKLITRNLIFNYRSWLICI